MKSSLFARQLQSLFGGDRDEGFRTALTQARAGHCAPLLAGLEALIEQVDTAYAAYVNLNQWTTVLSGDALMDWNLLSGAIDVKRGWKEMLGYADLELVNSFDTWKELMHAEDRPRVMAAFDDYLHGRSQSFEVEYRLWHRDATYRWVLARGAALRYASGKPYRMAGSHTDLTAVDLS